MLSVFPDFRSHSVPDHAQCCNHQYNTDGQADPCRTYKACNDVGDEGYCRHGDGVGKLGGHMVHMVGLCSGACHNGSVGNRGAVVTAYRTGHTGRDYGTGRLTCCVGMFCAYEP